MRQVSERFVWRAYGAVLGAALFFAGFCIVFGYQDYTQAFALDGAGWQKFAGWRVLEKTGTGIALFLTTLPFVLVYARRGASLSGVIVFVITFAVSGVAWVGVLTTIAKGGDPGTFSEALATSPLYLAPAVLIAVISLVWCYRSAAIPSS
jgi:hypothetical protein